MPNRPRHPNLIAALAADVLLGVGSGTLVAMSDRGTDLTAVAGAAGIVVTAALFVLIGMVARWRNGARDYEFTATDAVPIETVAAMFDDPDEGIGTAPVAL